ncbi:MAG: hypothetical protein AAF791_13790 [Bacteroidota bacterium]
MRFLPLLVLLMASSAQAQGVPSLRVDTPLGERTLLLAAGLGGSAGTLALAAVSGEPVVLVLAPFASGGSVAVIGDVPGRGGSTAGALSGAVVAGLAGTSLVVAGRSLGQIDDLGLIVAGVVALALLPPVGAVIGYELGGPTLLRAPDGTTVPGVTLRLGL